MASSERTADGWRAFLRERGLDEGWTVRFTAGRRRAREMADQYRAAGFRARALPLLPDGGEPEPASLGRFEGADHDPLRGTDPEACAPCLSDTWVLLTRPAEGARGAGPGEPGGDGAETGVPETGGPRTDAAGEEGP